MRQHLIILSLLSSAALSAQTTFTGTPDNIIDALNWDNGLPTLTQQGTISSDATWPSDNDLDGWDLVLTGGTLTDGSTSYLLNEIMGGTKFDIQGGTWQRGGVVRMHGGAILIINGGTANLGGIAAISAAVGGGQDGGFTLNVASGSITMNNIINFNNQENTSTINVSGGRLTMGYISQQSRTIDEANTFFNISGGTLETYSLRMSANDPNIVVTVSGGELNIGAGGYNPNSLDGITDQRHINFPLNSAGTLTITDATQLTFEEFYTNGTLLFNGSNTAPFNEVFFVQGSTLSLGASAQSLEITDATFNPSTNEVTLRWIDTGTTYLIQATDDLNFFEGVSEINVNETADTTSYPGEIAFTFTDPGTAQKRFWRVKVSS